MNWMSIIGLCMILGGSVLSFIGTYKTDRKGKVELTSTIQEKNRSIEEVNAKNTRLMEENDSLLYVNNEATIANYDLVTRNNEMLSKIENYQKDLEERNKHLTLMEGEINNVKEYSYYATLDMYGRTFTPGFGMSYSSNLSGMMEKILVTTEGKVFVKNDKSNLRIINDVIERYPNFPFGYFAKSQVLGAIRNPEWKVFAQKTIDILEKTTSIKGHNKAHDEALARLRVLLAAK